ncbi:response regulator [bacterium]|nr:response regulator [bacterium]
MPAILIVDDEEGVRITLKKILEKQGYLVDTAGYFEEAMIALNEKSYDTVVADIKLPGMSGIDLIKDIKKQDEDLPVIMITGDPNIETAAEAVRQGAYDYVPKPITKHNLPPVVSRAVDKKALMDEKRRLEKENLEYQRDLERKVKERTEKIEALNQILKESQAKLILSERLATLGTFISFVSHDLRNPLSVIHNSIYYLRGRIKSDDPKVEKYFGIIEDEVKLANKIIDDFLLFTKGRPLDLQWVNINGLISKIIDLVVIPGNIRLVLDFKEDLPDIEVDGDQIRQVLVNMINNAIQAMPGGGDLTIGTKIDGKFVVTDISDTGIGMSNDDLARLFDPFFSKKEKGTGLGLVICKFLIDRHYGKISVTSHEGKGSTFSIHLPVSQEILHSRT